VKIIDQNQFNLRKSASQLHIVIFFSRILVSFVFVTLLLSCGVQRKYVVIRESEISYVPLTTDNIIPITDSELQASSFLGFAYSLIKSHRYDTLDWEIDTAIKNGTAKEDVYLSKVLLCISKGSYQMAANYLNMISTEYPLLQELLSTDMSFELQRKNFPDKPNDKFFEKYQLLVDKYPKNENLKMIVRTRLRYIQHKY